jgi:hypothetical protein
MAAVVFPAFVCFFDFGSTDFLRSESKMMCLQSRGYLQYFCFPLNNQFLWLAMFAMNFEVEGGTYFCAARNRGLFFKI